MTDVGVGRKGRDRPQVSPSDHLSHLGDLQMNEQCPASQANATCTGPFSPYVLALLLVTRPFALFLELPHKNNPHFSPSP